MLSYDSNFQVTLLTAGSLYLVSYGLKAGSAECHTPRNKQRLVDFVVSWTFNTNMCLSCHLPEYPTACITYYSTVSVVKASIDYCIYSYIWERTKKHEFKFVSLIHLKELIFS